MRFPSLAALLALPLAALAQDASAPARQDVWARVHSLSATLARASDSRLALTGLARIGALVCRYDRGEARVAFLAAADHQQRLGARVSWAAWRQVLLSADACLDGMAAELEARARIRPPSPGALEAALANALDTVQDDPLEAAGQMEPAVPFFADLSTPGQESFASVLLQIRAADSGRADALFADTLGYLALRPAASLAPLFVLGNYLYTSPDAGAAGPAAEAQLTPLEGPGGRVYLLTVERPEASPELTVPFLEAAGAALALPSSDPRRFLLAYQLYPRAAEISEPLAAPFRAALDAGVAPSPDVLARFRPLGVLSDSALLDFQSAWNGRRPDAARTVLADYPLGPVKDRLSQLAGFAEAAELLRSGHVNGALDAVRPLPSELLRTLVYLGAAAASRDARYASSLLSLAAGEIDKCPPSARPSLWLALASVQARADAGASFFALGQWVKTVNSARSAPPSGGLRATPAGFVQTVHTASGNARFWLRVPGVDGYTLAQALPALARLDPDRAEATVTGIRDPGPQWEARLQALAARLAAAFQ